MIPKFIFAKNQEKMYEISDLLVNKKYKIKSEDKNYVLLRKSAYGNIFVHIGVLLIALFLIKLLIALFLINYAIIINVIYFLYNFYMNSIILLVTTEKFDDEGKPLEFIDLYDLEDFVYESGKTEKNRDIVEDFKNVIKRSRKK